MLLLKATNLTWINGQPEDPTDQCAHGRIELVVNGHVLYRTGEKDITVSAACLYLLRTVEDDHTPELSVAEGNWLFPCCGFNLFPEQGRYKVSCMGCNTGTDVFVRHLGDRVLLTYGEREAVVSQAEWRAAVLGLALQVENFYAGCAPKAVLEDDFDIEGWRLFWSEWKARKGRAERSVV